MGNFCYEISSEGIVDVTNHEAKTEHTTPKKIEFKEQKCYCLIGIVMMKEEKENHGIFLRLGSKSSPQDREKALSFASSQSVLLGRDRPVIVFFFFIFFF